MKFNIEINLIFNFIIFNMATNMISEFELNSLFIAYFNDIFKFHIATKNI